jgi:hypothetical protein
MKKEKAIFMVVLILISAGFDFYRGYQNGKSIAQGALFVMFGLGVLGLFWWAYSRRNSK